MGLARVRARRAYTSRASRRKDAATEIVGTADPFPTEGTKLPRLRSPSPSLLLSPKDQCGTKSALTHCEPTAVLDERFTLTFANGAKLTSVTNDAQTQDEGDPEAMARLEKMLPDGKFTHAFYMPPHEPDYFAEHAAADKDGRSVNSSVLGHTNCCVSDTRVWTVFTNAWSHGSPGKPMASREKAR